MLWSLLVLIVGIAITGCEPSVGSIHVTPGGSASKTFVLKHNVTYIGTYRPGEAYAEIASSVPNFLKVDTSGGMAGMGERWLPEITMHVYPDLNAPPGKYKVTVKWQWREFTRYFNNIYIIVAKGEGKLNSTLFPSTRVPRNGRYRWPKRLISIQTLSGSFPPSSVITHEDRALRSHGRPDNKSLKLTAQTPQLSCIVRRLDHSRGERHEARAL